MQAAQQVRAQGTVAQFRPVDYAISDVVCEAGPNRRAEVARLFGDAP